MNNSRVPKIDMPQIDTFYNFCFISIFGRFFVDFYTKIYMSKVDTFFEFCAQLKCVNLWQRTVFCWQSNFYFEILSIFFFIFRFWEWQNQVLFAMEAVRQHWIGVFHMLEGLLEPYFLVGWSKDLLYEAKASFPPYYALHYDNVMATIQDYRLWISLLHILK